MNSKIDILVDMAPWRGKVDLLVRRIDGDGEVSIGTEVVFGKIPEGMPYGATMSIRSAEAQSLMDGLWSCGFRPTEGAGSAGALKATQDHLEDMRKIALTMLGKNDA